MSAANSVNTNARAATFPSAAAFPALSNRGRQGAGRTGSRRIRVRGLAREWAGE